MTLNPRGDLGDVDWAYCAVCNRDVELRPNGRLAPHVTHKGDGWAEVTCKGSLRPPAPRPEEGGEDA